MRVRGYLQRQVRTSVPRVRDFAEALAGLGDGGSGSGVCQSKYLRHNDVGEISARREERDEHGFGFGMLSAGDDILLPARIKLY